MLASSHAFRMYDIYIYIFVCMYVCMYVCVEFGFGDSLLLSEQAQTQQA